MTKYNLEENILLETMIDKTYFPNAFSTIKNTNWVQGEGIELIIRPQCNQKCKYCYITMFGDKLYPHEKRIPNDKILENLRIFINWIIENKQHIPRYELFAGDLYGDGLYFDILDVFYELYSQIPIEIIKNNVKNWGETLILMPTNGYYFRYDEIQDKMREYTKKMAQIGIAVGISWSTDGLYAVDAREDAIKDGNMTQEDYDKIFPFIKEMGYGIHPMLSPENIKNSIKNFYWWVEMLQKYGLNEDDNSGIAPPLLEVRNDTWDDDSIYELTRLIRAIWDFKLEKNQKSVTSLARHIFLGDGKDGSLIRPKFYDIANIYIPEGKSLDNMSCTMSSLFRLNLSDMSLPICHRVTYEQFNGGHFNIEDGKITGLIAHEGLSGYLQLKTLSPKFFPGCVRCMYKDVCSKGCYGAQFEHSGEILAPIESTCNMHKARIETILDLMNSYNLLETAHNNGWITEEKYNILKGLSAKNGYGYESKNN